MLKACCLKKGILSYQEPSENWRGGLAGFREQEGLSFLEIRKSKRWLKDVYPKWQKSQRRWGWLMRISSSLENGWGTPWLLAYLNQVVLIGIGVQAQAQRATGTLALERVQRDTGILVLARGPEVTGCTAQAMVHEGIGCMDQVSVQIVIGNSGRAMVQVHFGLLEEMKAPIATGKVCPSVASAANPKRQNGSALSVNELHNQALQRTRCARS